MSEFEMKSYSKGFNLSERTNDKNDIQTKLHAKLVKEIKHELNDHDLDYDAIIDVVTQMRTYDLKAKLEKITNSNK